MGVTTMDFRYLWAFKFEAKGFLRSYKYHTNSTLKGVGEFILFL
jgi:hypothetical protein